MKKLISLLCVFIITCIRVVYSQEYHAIQQDDSFYDFLTYWYDSTNYNVSDTAEGGKNSNVERLERVWLPRLSPSGDVSIAAESFIDYTSNFEPTESTYQPNWICLGPSSLPESGQGIGRMHRIEFDPNYNGTTNKVIYASSGFGGLWRTLDDGASWQNVNTDLQLPTTSVGDIAIDPNSSDTIYITTGLCDEGLITYEANTGKINPVFTSGIYRSDDYGNTWNNISLGILEDFENGGTLRSIKINPSNSSEIFIAGTTGIYRSSNGLNQQPNWNLVLDASTYSDDQINGFEFRPVSPYTTVIASGKDIYISTNSGTNWSSMTGPGTGLDLDDLNGNFIVQRINIAVTPANPNKVFAFIVGSEEYMDECVKRRQRLYIYLYDFNSNYWTQLHSATDTPYPNNDCDNNETNYFESISWDRLAFVVNPQNEYEYFYGTTKLYGTKNYISTSVTGWSPYSGSGFHADIHGLEFNPIDTSYLLCANDGGICRKNINYQGTSGWEYQYTGLEIATIWAHDNSEYNKDWIFIGLQDDWSAFKKEINGEYIWKAIGGGDGYAAQNFKIYPEIFNYWSGSLSTTYNYFSPTTHPSEHKPYDNLTQELSGSIKGFKIVQHPQKDTIYKGFNQIYKRGAKYTSSSNDWSVESDIAKYDSELEPSWKRQVIDFEISGSNPDYVYIVTLGVYNGADDWALPSHLFMSSTGLNQGNWNEDHFEELEFPGNGNDPFPVITSISVHPSNPEKIWITFSGYVQDYKVWSFDGTDWTNEDPDNSLNNLPVNDIIYQPGTNDRLYIATDAGVYVKDNTMEDWEKYGDFPNVRVTELKINYCSNKLRAATFGRGLWEGDLLPFSDYANERIIDDEITWSDIHALDKNLRITSSGKLILTSTLSMPFMGKIIVERGGELVIDGGIITNNCGQMWKGIEVWGTTASNQFTSGAQGKVLIENEGTIENAETAVILGRLDSIAYYGGGIIQTDSAHFINNQNGVYFLPYQNIFSGQEVDNLSYFENTEFLTDAVLANESIPDKFIHLYEVKGIGFEGCSFINSRDQEEVDIRERGYGIYSENSDFTVTYSCSQCQEKPRSVFRELNYGIYATNHASTKTFNVNNSNFYNNLTGIYFSAVNNATIIFDSIEVRNYYLFHQQGDIYGGIYIDQSTGYTIEENYIYNDNSYDPQEEIRSIGITVNNSGNNYNIIYRNKFDDLQMGILAQNQNRGTSHGTGLKLKCNFCTNNQGDFAVTGNDAYLYQGISDWQGANISGNYTSPAGNTFTHDGTDPYSDFNNTLSRSWITYFHHDGTINDLWVPKYYQNITRSNTYLRYDQQSACPTNYSGIGGGGQKSAEIVMNQEELKSRMLEMQMLRDSAIYGLSLWIDAGNTQVLNEDVETSTVPEALDIYDELMSVSPYVSDSVLSTSIGKEDVLINSMLRDIMIANPHAAKKEELREALEQRVPAIPEYMIAEIMNGLDSVSVKEQKEAEIAWYQQERDDAFNHLLYLYLSDTTINSREDSLISLITNYGNLNSNYFLTSRYMELGDTINAFIILSNLPNQFEMDSLEQSQHQDYSSIYEILRNLKQNGKPIDSLDATSREILYQIADHQSVPAAMAQNILRHIDNAVFEEVYILPTSGLNLRSMYAESYNDLDEDPKIQFEIYPNPCRDYFIIDYSFRQRPDQSLYLINNATGQIIEKGQLNDQQNQLIVRTSKYSSGLYNISFVVNGKVEKVVKLNIVR